MATNRIDEYDIGQLIGQGGFAQVYRGFHRKFNRKVAIKIVNIRDDHVNKETLDRLHREIIIHKKCKHPNIIELYECFSDTENVYITMELATNGNLYQFVINHLQQSKHVLNETSLSYLFSKIISGIRYLHINNIVHRDIKLSNILLSSKIDLNMFNDDPNELIMSCDYKICDFGLSIELQHPDEEHYTVCGSPNYIAPEIIRRRAHSFPADIWSLGCLFYNILSKLQIYSFDEVFSKYSQRTVDFIKSLLRKDPEKRLDIMELSRHPFLSVHLSERIEQSSFITLTTIPTTSPNSSTFTIDSKDLQFHPTHSDKSYQQEHVSFEPSTQPSLKYSDEPLLKRSQSSSKSNHQSSTSGHSYVESLENLRLSIRESLSKTLPQFRATQSTTNAFIASPTRPTFSSSRQSTVAIERSNSVSQTIDSMPNRIQPQLINSLVDGLPSFLYVSSWGEILTVIANSQVIYCVDIENMSSQTSESTLIRNSTQQLKRVTRLCVDLSCPLTLIETALNDNQIRQYEYLVSGNSIYSFDKLNSYSQSDRLNIKSTLTLINDPEDVNRWEILHSPRNSQSRKCDISDLMNGDILNQLYKRICALITALRTRIPKIVYYLTIRYPNESKLDLNGLIKNKGLSGESTDHHLISCKCMLMCNLPLPHFCIQFKDKTFFRYELSSGDVKIDYYIHSNDHNNTNEIQSKRIRWEGNISNNRKGSWTDADGLSSQLKRYMVIAQFGLNKCLLKEKYLLENGKTAKIPLVEYENVCLE